MKASGAGAGASSREGTEPSFEELLERLERALQRLADPAAPLEHTVSGYEEAARLLAEAQIRLEVAAARLQGIGRTT